MGQERLGPSYFFISLVLGPLNSLYGTCLPQGTYGARLLFFVSARTNKKHHEKRLLDSIREELREAGLPKQPCVWLRANSGRRSMIKTMATAA